MIATVVLFVMAVLHLSRMLLAFGDRGPVVALALGFAVVLGVGLLAVLVTSAVRSCSRSRAAPVACAVASILVGGLAGAEALNALTEEPDETLALPPVTQTFVADDGGFVETMVRMVPGSRAIELRNEDSVLHTLRIAGVPGSRLEAEPGASAVGAVELDPGIYTFFCEVPGHRGAGMDGTLVVPEAVSVR